MSPRFGIRDAVPSDLDRLMHDVWRSKKEGAMGSLHGLLSQPWGESKSGLHALRDGLTALAKLASQESAADRREAGWAPWPEVLGALVEERGDPEQTRDHPSRPHRALVWADRDADGKRLVAVVELDGDMARVLTRSWAQPQQRDTKPGNAAKPDASRDPNLDAIAGEALRLADSLPREDCERAYAAVKACLEAGDKLALLKLFARIEAAVERQAIQADGEVHGD